MLRYPFYEKIMDAFIMPFADVRFGPTTDCASGLYQGWL